MKCASLQVKGFEPKKKDFCRKELHSIELLSSEANSTSPEFRYSTKAESQKYSFGWNIFYSIHKCLLLTREAIYTHSIFLTFSLKYFQFWKPNLFSQRISSEQFPPLHLLCLHSASAMSANRVVFLIRTWRGWKYFVWCLGQITGWRVLKWQGGEFCEESGKRLSLSHLEKRTPYITTLKLTVTLTRHRTPSVLHSVYLRTSEWPQTAEVPSTWYSINCYSSYQALKAWYI